MHTFDILSKGGGVLDDLLEGLRRRRQPAAPALDGGQP